MVNPKQKQLLVTLEKFYNKPVTMVSLELVVSLIAIIIFTIFAIKPTLQTIARLINEIEEKQELDKQLQKKIVALSTAQEEYQRYLPSIKLLDQAIPSQPELVKTLKVIEKIASQNNVVIDGIKTPQVPEEKMASQQISAFNRIDLYLSVKVIGDYPSIRDFINELHQYRRVMIVEEIVFMVEDRIVDQQLRANMSVRVPFFGTNNAQ